MGLAVLTACSPKQHSQDQNARVSILLKTDPASGRALSVNGNEVSLPNHFCYAVHITGAGITETPPEQNVCGPETGMGQLSALAYNRGDTAELTIKVGPQRRFDLIGFPSPLGVDANGRAICGDLAMESSAGDIPNDRRVTLKVKGVKVESSPVLFATGGGDVAPGDNAISLAGVALVASPLMQSLGLSFGAPYLRRDVPGAAPAGCPATVAPPPTPRAAQTIFTVPGVGLSAPKASAESAQVQLHMVTTAPVLLRTPSSGGAGAEISTGLLEIERKRK